jgi:cytochrome b561
VDVSKRLWRAEPRDNSLCHLCFYFIYILLVVLSIYLAYISCFHFDLFGVLVLCAGTTLILLETPVEAPHQVCFVLELVEGIHILLVLSV